MKLSVNVLSDYNDSDLNHIKVEITPQFARRLKLLRDMVKKVKATYIEEWDTPDFFNADGEESEAHIEISTVKVSDTDFHWEGIIKHTDCRWETDYGNFDEVNEVLKVARTPRKNLPLLIGKLVYEDALKLLEERMKK